MTHSLSGCIVYHKSSLNTPQIVATPLPHDTGYKLLFSHPRLVQDLLTGFIKPVWLNRVDLNSLEPYKASFVTDDMRQRHDDSIWRLRFTSSDCGALQEWLYLYLLIEFQSSNEYFMANRTMTYTGLLNQDIIRAYKLRRGDKLPPIMPIVLYNGREPWTGPQDVKELIQPVPSRQRHGPSNRSRPVPRPRRNSHLYRPLTAPIGCPGKQADSSNLCDLD